MATAARDAVVDAGVAVVGPVDAVVDDAPAGGHGAAWKGATTVAHVHRAANRRRDSRTGSAHVERFASAAQHDEDNFGCGSRGAIGAPPSPRPGSTTAAAAIRDRALLRGTCATARTSSTVVL